MVQVKTICKDLRRRIIDMSKITPDQYGYPGEGTRCGIDRI